MIGPWANNTLFIEVSWHWSTTPNDTEHIGWLRAAVLGANDGIVSTASLLVGVASAQTSHSDIMIAGVAGLVAGAMSMAATAGIGSFFGPSVQ